jgi:hypothetical protein
LAEVVNGQISPRDWDGDRQEIAVQLLREGARRGKGALYVSSGRDAISTAT